MKVTQETNVFQPVTLVITSQEELDNFVTVLRGCYWRCDDFREGLASGFLHDLVNAGVIAEAIE